MNRILLFIFFLSLAMPIFGQDKPVQGNVPKNLDPKFSDSLNQGQRGSRSTSNRNVKNLDAKIEDYKIISRENDTTYLDTTLTIFKDYKFNYLRRDRFDLVPFSNIGQTHNTLSFDLRSDEMMPLFGARARHFNFMEADDINYYHVPTPLTELMYKTAFSQGQVLDAFFTVNTSKRFNFSVGYKGLRSLGKYQHILTSTGNFRFTSNYRTKNDRYRMRAHIVAQDLLNEENGGLRDEDIINFESGNPEFLDRGVFDPLFENAESVLEGTRYHLEHEYDLIKQQDSIRNNSLTIGNVISYTDKFYEYRQTAANDVFGEAFESEINERTKLEDFYAEANSSYSSKTIGELKARIGYRSFNYGYDQLVLIEGQQIDNRLKGDVVLAGGGYKNQIGKLKLKGDFGIMLSGDFSGNYLDANVSFDLNDDVAVGASLNLNSRAPNYNYLLYQSDYLNYNWQNDFENVKSKQLAFQMRSKKWIDLDVDYTSIDQYTYFTKNADGVIKPFQTPKAVNYFRIKLAREISFGKFHLMNTIRYQSVIDGEGIFNVPELISRNTFYYANHFFKNNALYLQTGINFTYFSQYNMNAYDPVLSEFYIQNETELGGFPLLDFFINIKVRQTRVFLKAEHFNSAWTGYNYYSAPNYPYRDFTVRFGLVWNFFL
ncbi:MAG: putative porin [Bacteroidia bacterium]|nr:putative porin [Bacteroidia bacterium]